MKRISLYYPAINIPNGTWLRNAILYADKLSSITPYLDFDQRLISDEMKLLADKGLYSPLPMEQFFEIDTKKVKTFEKNFSDTINSEAFQKLKSTKKISKHFDNSIYLKKFTKNTMQLLKLKQLLHDNNQETVTLEKNTAIIYMSMLSELVSDSSDDLITPSTDRVEYESLAFKVSDNQTPTYQIELKRCLPTVNPTVSLKKLISFRLKREDELLRFRSVLEGLQKSLNDSKNQRERLEIIIGFGEKLKIEIKDLKKMYGSSGVGFALNTFKSLLDFKKPEIMGTAGAFGLGGVVAKAAIPFAGPVGLGVGAVVLGLTTIHAGRNNARELNRQSFSYLYHAQRSKMVIFS